MSYEKRRLHLFNQYPAIPDLAEKAKKRIPTVAWAYLQTGTGTEDLIQKNIEALKRVVITPRFCKGYFNPTFETHLLGQSFSAPFGIGPVGLTGLMWPGVEVILAKTAKKYQIPYTLSTVATETPEVVGAQVGNRGWFQLYPPKETELMQKLLIRAQENGFHTLVVTADVPTPSRRERTIRAGLRMPPKITPGLIWQGLTHPNWGINTIRNGLPRLRTIEQYSEFNNMMAISKFVANRLGGNLSWEDFKLIREVWKGPVVIKGLLHSKDVEMALKVGLDGIVVSNHGGRQFDAAPTSIEALPSIVEVVNGEIPILFDSGVRNGLDIIRALYLGADFVLLGRAFIYGVAALGEMGGFHVVEILKEELRNNMAQIGVSSIQELKDFAKSERGLS